MTTPDGADAPAECATSPGPRACGKARADPAAATASPRAIPSMPSPRNQWGERGPGRLKGEGVARELAYAPTSLDFTLAALPTWPRR